MKKVNCLAALMLAVSLVFVTCVLTSCSMQKNEDNVPPEPQVRTDTITNVQDNVLTWDGVNMYYNKQKALTAYVTGKKVISMPKAQHAEAAISGTTLKGWTDTNGNEFVKTMEQYDVNGLILNADIYPSEVFSRLDSIHPKISMVTCNFVLKGMATTETGKSKPFELPVVDGVYFLADNSVDVEVITKDSLIVRTDSVTEYIKVHHDAVVVSGLGYASVLFKVNNTWFDWRIDLDSTFINRSEETFGKAEVTSSDQNGLVASDNQKGTITSKASGMSGTSSVNKVINFTNVPGDENLKMATISINVNTTYTNEDGAKDSKTFDVYPFYFHKLIVKAEPEVVTPPVVGHTYEVDSTHTNVIQDGKLVGVKVKFTIKRDGETISKGQYLEWETGLATGTVTGTQVGDNVMLRPTTFGKPEEYKVEGWWGEENLKGATLTAYSLQYKFRTAFKAVPGFGQSEESIAETNLVFCKRSFDFTDPECPEWAGVHFKVDGDLNVIITEDYVGSDEQAKAEVNGRGLEYEYIGTHYLSFDQYVGDTKVTSQSRAENLLFPKN